MDNQLFEMLNQRFDAIDSKLEGMTETFKVHTDKDEIYWRKIDAKEAQLDVFKWLTGTSSGAALLAWIYQTFAK